MDAEGDPRAKAGCRCPMIPDVDMPAWWIECFGGPQDGYTTTLPRIGDHPPETFEAPPVYVAIGVPPRPRPVYRLGLNGPSERLRYFYDQYA